MIKWNGKRLMVAANALAAALVILLTGSAAGAQSLSVLPVNIFFPAGQKAATLTITNQEKARPPFRFAPSAGISRTATISN